jgi:hypothetical protein
MMVGESPKALIRVPSEMHGVSLSRAVARLPGEKGLRLRAQDGLAVVLEEYPRNGIELEILLDVVRAWLNGVDIEKVEVVANGKTYVVEPGDEIKSKMTDEPPEQAPRQHGTRLYWKFEDGPENAEIADPNDVGPAWTETPSGDQTAVDGGAWITRAEARRIALDKGYLFEEDD